MSTEVLFRVRAAAEYLALPTERQRAIDRKVSNIWRTTKPMLADGRYIYDLFDDGLRVTIEVVASTVIVDSIEDRLRRAPVM